VVTVNKPTARDSSDWCLEKGPVEAPTKANILTLQRGLLNIQYVPPSTKLKTSVFHPLSVFFSFL
jgi:hypothetical protein